MKNVAVTVAVGYAFQFDTERDQLARPRKIQRYCMQHVINQSKQKNKNQIVIYINKYIRMGLLNQQQLQITII